MVSFTTFDWNSLRKLRSTPLQSTIVMLATTVTVLITHDLAKGVVLGVLLSVLFFARKVGKMISVTERADSTEVARRYVVEGQLFFVSAELFAAGFEFHGHPAGVEIDMTGVRLWDLTAVGSLDKVVLRYRRRGATVEVVGLDEAGAALVARLGAA